MNILKFYAVPATGGSAKTRLPETLPAELPARGSDVRVVGSRKRSSHPLSASVFEATATSGREATVYSVSLDERACNAQN